MNTITTDPTTGQTLIFGKDMRFWLVISVLFAVFLITCITIATTALVTISYSFGDQARKGDVKLQVLNSKGEQKPITLFGNVAFIPRDSQTISAQTNDSSTIRTITDLPLFGIADFKLTLQPQQQVSKVGAEGLGCNLTNEFGLFTYNCSSITTINQINRPDAGPWASSPVESGRTEVIFSRYKSGFLALKDKTIEYLIPGKTVQLKTLPADFMNDADNVDLITDTNSANTAFTVANYTKGSFLRFTDFANNQPVAFSRKADTNPQFNLSICAMNATQLSCYYGPDSHDHNNTDEDTAYRASHKKGSLEIITTQNDIKSQLFQTDGLPHADQIFQTTDGLYLTSEKQLYRISVDASHITAIRAIAANVQTVASSSTSIFFTTDDDQLFEYNDADQSAYLRFHSKHITSLGLSVYGSSVLINAFINVDSTSDVANTAHVYQLTESVLPATAVRKEDKLPYNDASLPISYMDYSDKLIYVNLEQVFNTNPQTGERTINTTETTNQQSRVADKLRSDGFLTEGVKLLFVD